MSITKASLIDLNGQELILDADADTSITADTDDQIDIKIAGSDVITLTNSAINIGSATLNNNAILKLQTEGSDVANLQSAVQFRSHNDDFGITMQLESEASSNDILNVKYHNNSSGGVSVLQVDATNGNVVFNESGNNQDFRVEGDSQANLLFVDASADKIGIGTNSPDSLLELETAVTNSTGGLLLTNTNASGYSIVQFKNTGGTAQTYTLALGGSSSAFAQKLYIYDDTDSAARVVLDHSGKIGINTQSPSALLHIKDGDGTEPTFATDDLLIVQNNDDADDQARITIVSGNQGQGRVGFGDDGGRDRGRITYDHSDNSMAFGTNGSAANVKVLSGGNVEIVDGDLKVASGHGIDFSATGDSSGSMSSELLDDYEEGTWTPAVGGSSSNPSLTYGVQSGSYTKIGNQVDVYFYVQITGVSSQGSGIPNISGLPFSSTSGYSGETPGVLAQAQVVDITNHPFIRTSSGVNFAHIGEYAASGGTSLPSTANSINTGYLIGSLRYTV